MMCSSPPRARRAARTSRAGGFTLIEVLIATFVIALGSLGLLALFAGAAVQQQNSSRSTSAGFLTNTARATMAELFRGSTFEHDHASGLAEVRATVWEVMPLDRSLQYLSVPPSRRMLRSVADEVVYRNTDSVPTEPDATPSPTTQAEIVQPGDLRPFQHDEIEPTSVRVRIGVSHFIDTETPGVRSADDEYVVNGITATFSRQQGVSYPSSGFGDDVLYFPQDGNAGLLPDEFLGITGNESYVPMSIPLQGSPRVLEVVTPYQLDKETLSVAGGDLYNPRLEEVVVSYSYEEDKLLSSAGRFVTRPDETAQDGSRPDLGYSAAIRKGSDGSTQAAIFSYQFVPSSSSATYRPPETASDINSGEAPLRMALLRLGFDRARNQYYFTADAADVGLLRAGQLILATGRSSDASNPPLPTDDGADDVSRVVSVEKQTDNTLRAYVDRGPRSNNRSMLTAAQREAESTVSCPVVLVNDRIQSLARDRSEWTLRPIDAVVVRLD